MNDIAKGENPYGWVTVLSDHFEKHGLEVVFSKAYDHPRRYLRVWSDLCLHLMEEIAESMKREEELLPLISKAAEELQRGCVNPSPAPLLVVGRKPTST
jgi:hypothetical protein